MGGHTTVHSKDRRIDWGHLKKHKNTYGASTLRIESHLRRRYGVADTKYDAIPASTRIPPAWYQSHSGTNDTHRVSSTWSEFVGLEMLSALAGGSRKSTEIYHVSISAAGRFRRIENNSVEIEGLLPRFKRKSIKK